MFLPEGSGLLNRISHLYNNRLFSDVEYRVKDAGGQYTSFYAHKLILAMAGEGFARIFYNPKLEQSAHRKITEFTPDVFDLMLKFVYTDKIRIPNLEDAMNVFQLAKCFSIRDLMLECVEFLTPYEVNHDSVFAKYDCALEFNNRPLIDTCRELVKRETQAVFSSPFFCMASRYVIEDILKLDLNVPSELEVIEAVLKWCKADCTRRHGSTEYLYVRDSFLPFCENLRFLTLNLEEFVNFVEDHELLLTKHEIDQFIARLFNKNDRKLSIPQGFSYSQISRFVKLADCSSTIGPVNRLDISQRKSNGLYSYTNRESHSMKASSNRNQSNNTAKKSSAILIFNAQSNGYGNSMITSQNYKQSYPPESSGPNNFSLSGSPPVNRVNNYKHSHTQDRQAYNSPPLSNPPRQVYVHSNSTNSKVLTPASPIAPPMYSSSKPVNSTINNEPLFVVLPKTKHTPTRRAIPQQATKDPVMSYEFQLHEMQKQISSSCESDIKSNIDIKMLKGTILIHGIELKVKSSGNSTNEEEIEVYLCITSDEYNIPYQQKVKPINDILQLPFADPIIVSPMNLVDIEVMIDDLKMSRCGVCRTQENKCELNCGLDVTAQIELRSNQSNGNDSFVFLISKILYSVPKY